MRIPALPNRFFLLRISSRFRPFSSQWKAWEPFKISKRESWFDFPYSESGYGYLNKTMKVASFFAGVGGIDLGFLQAGFDIVWANNSDCINMDEPLEENIYYRRGTCPFYETLALGVQHSNTLYQWRRHYVRQNRRGLCPTLTANMGTGGHNVPILISSPP